MWMFLWVAKNEVAFKLLKLENGLYRYLIGFTRKGIPMTELSFSSR